MKLKALIFLISIIINIDLYSLNFNINSAQDCQEIDSINIQKM